MKSIKAVPVRSTPVVALPFSMDALGEVARDRVRQALNQIAQEELTAFLAATETAPRPERSPPRSALPN
jgi:hypothetical protein